MSKAKDAAPAIQEIADAIALVAVEVVAVLSPDTDVADTRLEELASRLVELVAAMPKGATRRIISGVAETLIATEEGAIPKGWEP